MAAESNLERLSRAVEAFLDYRSGDTQATREQFLECLNRFFD